MSAAEMFDDALDDEGDFALLREDGYSFDDIAQRRFLDDEGRYVGPKDQA